MSKDHISPQFIELVRKWVKIDDHIKEEMIRLREKKEEKKELEEKILNIMKQTDQDVLNISTGGTLRMSVSKTKSGLKEEYLREAITKFTKSQDEATIMTQAIMNDRPVNERTYLKRCRPRNIN
jgi:L-asparaginase/Glu-tRNA(Gln) amidotransferase subunit D